ncbi:MAG: flavodoxin family protein [Candidatus Methanomethylophilaceae archaeon]|jgi:multimeric flavodoxin WrbA
MKVLLVNGGGRPDGVTSYLCGLISDTLSSEGYDVSVLDLTEHDMGFCTGCGICGKTGRCYQDDGADRLTDRFMASDLVIFATPVRFSGTSAILKRYMERFQPYWFPENRRKGGRMTAVICGGSERPDFINVSRELRAFSITMGREWSDPLEISGTDNKDPGDYASECLEWIGRLQI